MKRVSSASLGWGASAHDGNHFRLMRAAAAAGLAIEGVCGRGLHRWQSICCMFRI
jgi:hypothetical protein